MDNYEGNKSGSSDIVMLKKRSKQTYSSALKIDLDALQRQGFQVVRQYGVDEYKLERELSLLSGGKLFFSKRMGGICHRFKVLPSSQNFSEQMRCGGYHTDFMFQPSPPAFIALLCLIPDPKHPFYGRNQIVHIDDFINKMKAVYGVDREALAEMDIAFELPNKTIVKQPILAHLNGKMIVKFHELMMSDRQPNETLSISLKDAFHAVFSDVAYDICLDQGDLLIISNHHAFHRRSECSITFNSEVGDFMSREMATIRFDL